MLEINQNVIVITEKGIAYEGYIMARGTGENGAAAYKIGVEGAGFHFEEYLLHIYHIPLGKVYVNTST